MDQLSASARLVIFFHFDHIMDPSAVTVHPSGVEKTLHERMGGVETSREKSFWFGWIVYYLYRLVMCSAVVQPLARSVLRRAMVHMGSPGCMYNSRSCKDRK